MLSVGPDAPPALRPLLGALVEAVRALQTPGAPTPVFACAAADLPPAAAWPQTLVLVADLSTLAVSDGSAWVRQDTGAVI
ncbi:hypothetical protein [Phenylobacterium sp.]|uniref:hypothetical protein n=1 Tax=Phenylobacterium sp. TaxID=1871053 RepID=UPI002730C4DD|nr:hypothetical protein [Phenylobacterium sp.]MDP1616781.1 hypothetical protein [Phenylobacterium sp.]MDP1988273.1 hypothetical protein [Phenylobacterium sp.]